MNSYISAVCGVMLCCSAFAQEEEGAEELPLIDYSVSLIRVISNPNFFDGKKVSLSGYLLNRLGWYLFIDKMSCLDFQIDNSVFLNEVSIVDNIPVGLSKYEDCHIVNASGLFESLDNYGKPGFLLHSPQTEGMINNPELY